jgi:hypothetical protein
MERRKIEVIEQLIDDDLANHGNNRKETFHAVNDDLAQKTGIRPYKSYQSYKSSRCRNRKGR